MSPHVQDIVEYTGLNIASTVFLIITFRWHELIPSPDRLVEWVVGLIVGASMIALNAYKLYREYKKSKP